MNKRLEYISRLDFIRSLAILLVLFHHFIPTSWVKYGPYGVSLFFVLSGFLITRILLNEKNRIIEKQISFWESIRVFFIRRSLRILPIYYLCFLSLYALHQFVSIDIKGPVWYYLFYSTNFLIFNSQNWIGMFSHTWSLSVEEQFYLLWPFIILATPLKHIKIVLFSVILSGIIFTLAIHLFNSNLKFSSFLLPCCMPAFAVGALLAHNESLGITYCPKYLQFFKIAGVSFLFLLLIPGYFFNYDLGDKLGYIYYAIPASFLIIYIINDKNKLRISQIYENKLLIHIGKISYGLYLYHMPVYFLWPYLNHRIYNYFSIINIPTQLILNVLSCFLITYTIALISWNLIEKPMNNLKRHFN